MAGTVLNFVTKRDASRRSLDVAYVMAIFNPLKTKRRRRSTKVGEENSLRMMMMMIVIIIIIIIMSMARIWRH